MQEQIQMFNSLPASQQQALIRELQRQLPPAERDAMLSALQGQVTERAGTAAATPVQSSIVGYARRGVRDQSDAEKGKKETHGSSRTIRSSYELSQRKDTPQIVRLPDDQQKLEDFSDGSRRAIRISSTAPGNCCCRASTR